MTGRGHLSGGGRGQREKSSERGAGKEEGRSGAVAGQQQGLLTRLITVGQQRRTDAVGRWGRGSIGEGSGGMRRRTGRERGSEGEDQEEVRG